MKTLEKMVATVYRFRCDTCRSEFEIGEKEQMELEWEFTDSYFKERDKDLPLEKRFRCDGYHHFHCPICGKVRYVRRGDWHKIQIMDSGAEIRMY